MKNKGFTLVELLAVIVILGLVAAITTIVIVNVLNDSKKNAFVESVHSAMDSYKNHESYNNFSDLGEMSVRDLPLDNNNFKSGTVMRNENNEILVINLTDGSYCANGTRNNLVISDGKCE